MTVSDRVLPGIAAPAVARGRLRLGWGTRFVAALVFGFAPALLLVFALDAHGGDRAASWGVFGFTTACCALVAYGILRARWLVDDDGILPRSFVFRKVACLPWSAITEISTGMKGNAHGIFVRHRFGSIFLSLGLEGLDAFAYFALTHASGAIASPTLRRSLEARASKMRPFAALIVAPEIGDPAEAARARVRDNPFYVLGVGREASRAEVERAGQKLLAMLGVGASAARTYATPLGPAERTADEVRAALAELRAPEKRLAYELDTRAEIASAAREDGDPTRPWTGALAAVGWRRR